MPLADRIKQDMQNALRDGDKARLGALRLLLSELQKSAKDGSQDAARATPAGSWVTPVSPSATPAGPSSRPTAGMHSAGIAGV